MKIAILTLGTRGDVQPYAVLGKALQERGHTVTLSTGKNFETFIRSYGIDFLPVDADFQEMLNSEEGKKMLKGNPITIVRNIKKWVYPVITDSLVNFYQLAVKSDLVLYHVKTLADCFADQFPQKMIRANVLPIIEPTSAFANPSLSGLPIPGFLNRMSYTLSNLSIQLLSRPIAQFRAAFGLPVSYKIPEITNLYGISPAFLPVPNDYPKASKFTGFWYGKSDEELSEELLSFIESGEPPFVLTFGSMPFKCKFDLQSAIINLNLQTEYRIIVIKGWGITETSMLSNNSEIKVIDSAPYDKLFPKAKAIIHHGGIGTTAECIRAGKPFMICPILYPIGDQKFWGIHSQKLGIAVKPCPVKKISEKKFIAGVKELLFNQTLYTNAAKLKLAIDKEDGLQQMVLQIEQFASKINVRNSDIAAI